jgi:YfiH family protein
MSAPSVGYLMPDWPAPAHIRAAFTLRTGGVSRAPYDSLNLGAAGSDAEERVAENRRRVRQALHLPAEPVWLHQVHGAAVVDIDACPARVDTPRGDAARIEPVADAAVPTADAAVTSRPGRVCVVRIADCLPVLFAATDGSKVAAAHAGWRGLAGGVLEATVGALAMEPARLVAWLGPAIGPQHFEVGEDVHRAFTVSDASAASAFVPNERGRWHCDLPALARLRLTRVGVSRIFGGNWCTYSDPARFFSYRRDGECGRMAALIWMEPP